MVGKAVATGGQAYGPESYRRHFRIPGKCAGGHHRPSSLGMLTPAMVHFDQTAAVLAQRQTVLDAAYLAHPKRFVRKPPTASRPPSEVWINPPIQANSEEKTH